MALSMQARTLSGATRALPVRRTAGAGRPYDRLLGAAMSGDGALSPGRMRWKPPGRWLTQS